MENFLETSLLDNAVTQVDILSQYLIDKWIQNSYICKWKHIMVMILIKNSRILWLLVDGRVIDIIGDQFKYQEELLNYDIPNIYWTDDRFSPIV